MQFLLVVKEIHIRKWNSSLIQPCGDGVAPIDVDPVEGSWAGGAHVGADCLQKVHTKGLFATIPVTFYS